MIQKGKAFIYGKNVEFRPLEKDNLQTIRKWINSIDYRRYSRNEFPLLSEKHNSWYESLIKTNEDIMFTVWHTKTEQLIGDASVYNINKIYRNAEIGFGIGEDEFLRKGFGTEIVFLLCDYSFKELNLHRIYATVIAENTGSIKCLEKNGFKQEGIFRDDVYIDGKYIDNYRYSILKDEWFSRVIVNKVN